MMQRYVTSSVVALCVLAAAAVGENLRVGDSRDRVLLLKGVPQREIQTANGALWFYGTLLVTVENGRVTFLSVGHPDLPSVSSSALVSQPRQEIVKPLPPESMPTPRTWIEEGQDRHAKVVAERLHRCLALRVYDRMLARLPHRTAAAADGVCLVDVQDAQSVRLAAYGDLQDGCALSDSWCRVASLSGGWTFAP